MQGHDQLINEAVILERVTAQLDALERRVVIQEEHTRSLLLQLNENRPGHPGISIRLDRIEQMFRFLRWAASGGLVAIGGTLVLLYRILIALGGAGQL